MKVKKNKSDTKQVIVMIYPCHIHRWYILQILIDLAFGNLRNRTAGLNDWAYVFEKKKSPVWSRLEGFLSASCMHLRVLGQVVKAPRQSERRRVRTGNEKAERLTNDGGVGKRKVQRQSLLIGLLICLSGEHTRIHNGVMQA